MQVNEFLEKAALQFPDKPAVWFNGKWMTYREIDEKANQLANYLQRFKVQRGQRVAILYENSFNYIIAYYAILKAGAVTVALNTEITANDLVYLLNDSGSVAIIAQEKYFKMLQNIVEEVPTVKTIVTSASPTDTSYGGKTWENIEKVYETQEKAKISVRSIDIDLASIVYTSGSTGKPKGVTLTHLNIVTNTRSIVEYLELTAEDRIMVILPFYYIYGKSLLNTHFFMGGSVVIDNRFAFPNAILDTMKNTQCTGFSGVPSTFSILLNKSSLKKYRFESLRYITQAGGAMAPAVQKEVAITFYPAKLFIMYGATEASARLSYLNPRDLPRKWGSIGKPIPNVELFPADEKGNPLPIGEVGEIVARGANLMVGYWNDPKETKRALKNGLYYTGDIGYIDEDGFLFVAGRSKDMIKVAANRVSGKEVEEKILEYPKVHEVAVIGINDEILGEAIKAYVVPKPNHKIFSVEELLDFCKGNLAQYKVPKYVEVVESLPKNKSGKILKTVLKEQTAK
ncbi:MAG: class I adenylate-forming enzyme family protein [Calditrichia bacterium]